MSQNTGNIEEIIFTDDYIEMCDITVDEAHCYYAEGVLTHNSAEEVRICSNISREPIWEEAFISGGDIHKSCYSLDTEFLTKEGWKTYDKISPDTKLAMYDPNKGKVLYTCAGEPFFNKTDTMYHFTGEFSDLLVTPNHRMYFREDKPFFEIARADKLFENHKPLKVLCSPELSHEDTDLGEISYTSNGNKKAISHNTYLRLLCAVLANMNYNLLDENSNKIYLYRDENPVTAREYYRVTEKVVKEIPEFKSETLYGIPVYALENNQLVNILKKDLGMDTREYRLSNRIMNLTPKDIKILFEQSKLLVTYLYGKYIRFPKELKNMAEQLQLLAMSAGYSTNLIFDKDNKDSYMLYLIEGNREDEIPESEMFKVTYDEPVTSVCYSVPTGLLVVRRNGKISVCGNTAISLWGAENYNKDKRKIAKACTFGVIYGMGPSGLVGSKFGISTLAEAEKFYNTYKGKLSTLFSWIARVQQRARRTGTVYTYLGRPRRVRGYYEEHNIGFANRTAVNTQIQGTAGDLLKLVMCRLWKNLLNNPEYMNDIAWRVTIHDEIGYSVRASRATELIAKIEDNQTIKLKEWPVTLLTEASIGWSMGSVFAVERVYNDDGTFFYRPKLE